jgi:hypothetical protein
MKSAEMTETLIRAIQNYAEYYLAEHDESALYERLSTTFNLSDADIDAIGLGRLIPEPNEPNEPEKKTWKVHIRETWEGDFEVEASDWEEAYALACDLEYASADLDYTNREIEVEEN